MLSLVSAASSHNQRSLHIICPPHSFQRPSYRLPSYIISHTSSLIHYLIHLPSYKCLSYNVPYTSVPHTGVLHTTPLIPASLIQCLSYKHPSYQSPSYQVPHITSLIQGLIQHLSYQRPSYNVSHINVAHSTSPISRPLYNDPHITSPI